MHVPTEIEHTVRLNIMTGKRMCKRFFLHYNNSPDKLRRLAIALRMFENSILNLQLLLTIGLP